MHSEQEQKQKEGQAACQEAGLSGEGSASGTALEVGKQRLDSRLVASVRCSFPVLLFGIMMGAGSVPHVLGCRPQNGEATGRTR